MAAEDLGGEIFSGDFNIIRDCWGEVVVDPVAGEPFFSDFPDTQGKYREICRIRWCLRGLEDNRPYVSTLFGQNSL